MNDRDCNNCIRCTPDSGCTSWDCDYINRKEAIEVWKAYQKGIIGIKELSSSAEVKGE